MFCHTSVFYFDLVNDINRVDKKEYQRPRKRRIFTDNQRAMGPIGWTKVLGEKTARERDEGRHRKVDIHPSSRPKPPHIVFLKGRLLALGWRQFHVVQDLHWMIFSCTPTLPGKNRSSSVTVTTQTATRGVSRMLVENWWTAGGGIWSFCHVTE